MLSCKNYLGDAYIAGTTQTSQKRCNIFNGLEYLVLMCDEINRENNFFNGDESDILNSLELKTTDLLGEIQSRV